MQCAFAASARACIPRVQRLITGLESCPDSSSCSSSSCVTFTSDAVQYDAGRSLKPASRKLSIIKKAVAKQEAEGSEQGRLLRDALEFNKPRSESTIKQQAGEALAEPQVEFKAGDMLGNKYRVIEVLGRGKAGVTYKVRFSLSLL